MATDQFEAFRRAVLLTIAAAPGDALTAPKANKQGEPYSRAWRLAVTADDIAKTCGAVWHKSDQREAERSRR